MRVAHLRRAHSGACSAVCAQNHAPCGHEPLYSQTKAESFEANRHTGNLAADNLSFAKAASGATGKDERTVRRAAARGEALGEDLGVIVSVFEF